MNIIMRGILRHLPSMLAVGVATLACGSAAAQTSVHVASVDTSVVLAGFGPRGTPKYSGEAEVRIVDDLGDPVPGARVTGTFSGDLLRNDRTVSGRTDSDGRVILDLKSTVWGQTITFTFCVDDVSASLPYDPDEDVVTCDTDTRTRILP